MVRTINPDCRALGCDWAWDTESCDRCGRFHTFRVCARCLTPGEDPRCPTTTREDLAEDTAAVLVLIPAATDTGAEVAA